MGIKRYAIAGIKSLKKDGIYRTLKKGYRVISARNSYQKMKLHFQISNKVRQRQESTVFERAVMFSIVVPLYNTPLKYLKEMLSSVQKQTYKNWELCLADGSQGTVAKAVEEFCLTASEKDIRIKYKKLKENKGIAQNTNEALNMATGEYIALLDHDDLLHPTALYEMMCVIEKESPDYLYSDEATFENHVRNVLFIHFKPDYAPDTLRSYNYICHLSVFRKTLLEKTGLFRQKFDGSQDYDMILRLTEVADRIVHIPNVLYYWRAHKNSVASDVAVKPYTLLAAKKALTEHLERIGLKGIVNDADIPSTYRISYVLTEKPLVSIMIPNKDHIEDLDICIQSVQQRSTYRNFEIIIVENNSTEEKTWEYYRNIQKQYENVRVIIWKEEFNYSKINNFGFQYAKGKQIILMNNDIEILTPDWIEQMLMYIQRDDVGAVGMMLYYPDDTIQHAGVILGIGGVAGHSHKYFKRGDNGYASRLGTVQNLSAVTAACMMVRADIFRELNGFDEEFAVAFNDVDFCVRIREAGYLIVWTPFAEAYHYESKSRGIEDTPEKQKRFEGEVHRFLDKWEKLLQKGDPYYNRNLTLKREDFSVRNRVDDMVKLSKGN